MDESMEYENIIFSLSMLLPGKYDYTKEDFLTPLLAGRFKVPTVFTPAVSYTHLDVYKRQYLYPLLQSSPEQAMQVPSCAS